jgi:hypothetical protein
VGLLALGFLTQGVVDQYQGGHGFDHGHGPGQNTRIVPTATCERGVLEFVVHGILFVHDGGNRFKGHSKMDRLAI